MSHRRKEPTAPLKPSQCPACGSTGILYGKKSGLCKDCRLTIKRPRTGWIAPDGTRVRIRVGRCKSCGKLYGLSATRESCPACKSPDYEVVDQW